MVVKFKFFAHAQPGPENPSAENQPMMWMPNFQDKLKLCWRAIGPDGQQPETNACDAYEISLDKNNLNQYTSFNGAGDIVATDIAGSGHTYATNDDNWATFEVEFPVSYTSGGKSYQKELYILLESERMAPGDQVEAEYYFTDFEIKYAPSSITDVDHLDFTDKEKFKGLRQIVDTEFRVNDKPIVDRTPSGTHVIVERFSSPGDIYTMGEGSLDRLTGQYSPYNALSFRNRKLKNILNIESSKVYNKLYGYCNNADECTEAPSPDSTQQIHDATVDEQISKHKVHRLSLIHI